MEGWKVSAKPAIKIEFTAEQIELHLACLNMARKVMHNDYPVVARIIQEAGRLVAAENVLNRKTDPNFTPNIVPRNFPIPRTRWICPHRAKDLDFESNLELERGRLRLQYVGARVNLNAKLTLIRR